MIGILEDMIEKNKNKIDRLNITNNCLIDKIISEAKNEGSDILYIPNFYGKDNGSLLIKQMFERYKVNIELKNQSLNYSNKGFIFNFYVKDIKYRIEIYTYIDRELIELNCDNKGKHSLCIYESEDTIRQINASYLVKDLLEIIKKGD